MRDHQWRNSQILRDFKFITSIVISNSFICFQLLLFMLLCSNSFMQNFKALKSGWIDPNHLSANAHTTPGVANAGTFSSLQHAPQFSEHRHTCSTFYLPNPTTA